MQKSPLTILIDTYIATMHSASKGSLMYLITVQHLHTYEMCNMENSVLYGLEKMTIKSY